MPRTNCGASVGTPNESMVRHWHISEAFPGRIPESDPYVSDCVDIALDVFAHMLADYAEALGEKGRGEGDAIYAQTMSEICCSCTPCDKRSAIYGDLLARAGQDGVTKIIAERCFEITPCDEADCLKYCPTPGCGTVTVVTDVDTRCWACGARYVDADHRPAS